MSDPIWATGITARVIHTWNKKFVIDHLLRSSGDGQYLFPVKTIFPLPPQLTLHDELDLLPVLFPHPVAGRALVLARVLPRQIPQLQAGVAAAPAVGVGGAVVAVAPGLEDPAGVQPELLAAAAPGGGAGRGLKGEREKGNERTGKGW